jgi:hypothetical protein
MVDRRGLMGIPIGAAVRYFGALAKVVRMPRHANPGRGWLAIEFDGNEGTRLVRQRAVEYVAKHFETAKAWRDEKSTTKVSS